MDVAEALTRLKFLVRHNKFKMVRRTDKMAVPISVPLTKELIRQLSVDNFVKHEPNRNNPLQFVWIFRTADERKYYIKFVFIENNNLVVFISFYLGY